MKLPFDLELLKFPIGPFKPADEFTDEVISTSIQQIRKLPFRLHELHTELSEAQYEWCYRPEGWSIREVMHHLADSHMNAFLRLKWSLFEENTHIKGYDEAAWTQSADVTKAPIVSSLQLLEGLHERWAAALESLTSEDWEKGYFHPEQNRIVQLKEYVQLYAWHCEHHYRHLLLALDHEGKYKKV
jgi:hypothetical protein